MIVAGAKVGVALDGWVCAVGGSGFNLFRCWRMVMVIGNGCGDFCFLISEILGCCSGSFGGCW